METIIKTPGLQHITEKILFNLNYNDLRVCRLINQSTKEILDDPFFWLRKLVQKGNLSKKNQEDWKNAIHLSKNYELENFILSYLKMSSKNEKVVDLDCYIDEDFITKSAEEIKKNLKIENPNAHSLIRGILTQSCSAGAKNITKCVFYHVQFSGIIQNIAYHRAIFTLFVYVDYYQNNQFY